MLSYCSIVSSPILHLTGTSGQNPCAVWVSVSWQWNISWLGLCFVCSLFVLPSWEERIHEACIPPRGSVLHVQDMLRFLQVVSIQPNYDIQHSTPRPLPFIMLLHFTQQPLTCICVILVARIRKSTHHVFSVLLLVHLMKKNLISGSISVVNRLIIMSFSSNSYSCMTSHIY